ncbi:MAG: chromosomal replication initiator protein DnaA [Anaerolineae bacterium]|nr:chromosomal replication initiator protein DnaA [Anaerolineae bacterium]MDW8101977.1 chromosomal replication initiator protein DnaA [Anaerolineae bacterium]
MKPEEVWQATLGELQLKMTKATFDTWLRGTTFLGYEDGTFVIGVPTAFAKDWLENRLMGLIKRTASSVMGRTVEINFVVQPPPPPKLREIPPLLREKAKSYTFHPDYTFENFTVGPGNKLAYNAALAVARCEHQAYNPLFIYGGVGLGKTHLLHAIGHYASRNYRKALYISAEDFTNDFITSIRSKRTGDFRARYRSIDLFLMDDIQFLAGKECVQEELFHTFNALHKSQKQIVIASDRPPKTIHPLAERLRSRFEGGLVVEIQPPDLQTRIAILKAKAGQRGVNLPEEVIEFIASRIQSNVRELEGALNRVIAHLHFMGAKPTLETVSLALNGTVKEREETLSPEEVVKSVAEFFHLSPEDLRSSRRDRDVTFARQVAMYLLRDCFSLSFPQIAKLLGGKDHSTVVYGYERISRLLKTDEKVGKQLSLLKDYLRQR